jgi:hypothetical protein
MHNAWEEYCRLLEFFAGLQVPLEIPPEFSQRNPLEMPEKYKVEVFALPPPKSGMGRQIEIEEQVEDGSDIEEAEDKEAVESILMESGGPGVTITGMSDEGSIQEP